MTVSLHNALNSTVAETQEAFGCTLPFVPSFKPVRKGKQLVISEMAAEWAASSLTCILSVYLQEMSGYKSLTKY